jgi:hypothetical protein
MSNTLATHAITFPGLRSVTLVAFKKIRPFPCASVQISHIGYRFQAFFFGRGLEKIP